ncbi:MAG TPA: histidinol-phosphate transaminase [Saprospiraceae bacterium]|nr:histidinol-phosphate transaminase [Saprospiraceae bacterium]
MNLEKLVRPNIWRLTPYSSARHDFEGTGGIHLDANENPYETGLNRYPDPHHALVREKIAAIKGVPPEFIALGNGSDEIIDLLIRIFCQPGIDQIMTLDPTYGMYRVAADICDVQTVAVSLDTEYQPVPEAIAKATTPHTKLLFLCHPNNPTANALDQNLVHRIVEAFPGIVVIDEAYIDFCPDKTFVPWIKRYPNLVIMQTFSKAWGLAGIRLGMAFSSPEIIKLIYKVKPPYNISTYTQEQALQSIRNKNQKDWWVQKILDQRQWLTVELEKLPMVERVYPSDTNFILVRVDDAKKWYDHLRQEGIIIRNRSNVHLCDGCLRITVGTALENDALIQALKNA